MSEKERLGSPDQCECAFPVPQSPHELGVPVHVGSGSPPELEANTESFFVRRTEPQWGQGVPFHSVERTRTSLLFPHWPQLNS